MNLGIPREKQENHENVKIDMRITKIIKILEFHVRITNKMKTIEFHERES